MYRRSTPAGRRRTDGRCSTAATGTWSIRIRVVLQVRGQRLEHSPPVTPLFIHAESLAFGSACTVTGQQPLVLALARRHSARRLPFRLMSPIRDARHRPRKQLRSLTRHGRPGRPPFPRSRSNTAGTPCRPRPQQECDRRERGQSTFGEMAVTRTVFPWSANVCSVRPVSRSIIETVKSCDVDVPSCAVMCRHVAVSTTLRKDEQLETSSASPPTSAMDWTAHKDQRHRQMLLPPPDDWRRR